MKAHPRIVLLGALLLGTPVLAGCITSSDSVEPQALPDLRRAVFDTSRAWSSPLSPAIYETLPGLEVMVPSFDGTEISLGIYRPKIDGCDWDAEAVPETCRLPVVMDSGPYYADHIDREKFRPPLNEWLVPRGYAVVYMSVRGTGNSAGCMETMSLSEQGDVDAMVTWLGEQAWSSGKVGMMGRSYDGSTPFFAAATGNPYLTTIVPIAGVPSQPDLLFKNGTSEARGPIFTNGLYWAGYGVGALDGGAPGHRADHLQDQACTDVAVGIPSSFAAAATGDASSEYWQDRNTKPRVLENYKGSVWIVHGLEDWNVNPSQVVPFVNELQDAGIETKAWLGVWAHAYPDRVDEHRNVRWDWAEQTVRWFDFYLKGVGPKPALDVEVEDSLFVWRSEASYPPRDAFDTVFELSADGTLAKAGEGSPGTLVVGGSTGLLSLGPAGDALEFRSEPLEKDLRLAGLSNLVLTATPSTAAGGYLFAELYDVFPDGRLMRIGWAAMNLRFHQGGNTEMQTLVPGQPIEVAMEFEPLDAHVGRGHSLALVVHKAGVEDIVPSPSPEATGITVGDGKSQLLLSTIERPAILPTYVPPGLST
ncbi:MAG: CocE/NonD family hydrolase [Methanobacteriota archaeon]